MSSDSIDMSRRGLAMAGAVLACAFCALAASAARAEPPPGEAGWMYEPGKVTTIDLTLSPQAIADLEAEPGEYVEGGFSIHRTDGAPGGEEEQVGEELDEVGIRLKGHVGGSFRDLGEKPGLKIKFKKFDGPKFEGLKKLTLNNMVQDPSMLHETMAYAAFRAIGVPAPRTGYAEVRLNGEDLGVYLNVEAMDDVALERWFGDFDDPQHLYEGEYGADVAPGEAEAFEVDEGDDEDLSDLEALIAAVNSGEGPDWSTQVTPVADLRELTRMWAVEKYVGHWDGYSGTDSAAIPGSELPNNYYLYSDADGVFQMLPWGTDQTWADHLEFEGDAGLMFDKCLADAACEARYREALAQLGHLAPGLELDSLASCLAAQLAPWQEAELESRREFDAEEIAVRVEEAREFIASRPGELSAWLESHPSSVEPTATASPIPCGPEPEPEPESEPEAEPTVETAQLAPTVTPPLSPPASDPELAIDETAVDNGVLRVRLRLSRPGRVRQVVRIRIRHRAVRVCAARARISHAGRATLRCRLSRLARRHLRSRWLKLLVALRFEPSGARPSTVRRKVVAPRLRD